MQHGTICTPSRSRSRPTPTTVCEQLAQRLDSETSGLVTAYQATSGKSEILTDLWAFEQPWDGSYRPGDPLRNTPLRQCAPEESLYFLNPLPGSPLQ